VIVRPTIWVRLRLSIAEAIYGFLKERAMKLHQEARNETDPIRSLDLRLRADDSDEEAEGIKQRLSGKE
jgi:hypothetical protein